MRFFKLSAKKIQRFAEGGKVEKIIPGLHDADPAVRDAAAEALEASDDPRAVDALISYWKAHLQNQLRYESRWDAVSALGRLWAKSASITGLMIEALYDSDWRVRRNAALRLGWLAREGHLGDHDVFSATAQLLRLLKGRDIDLRVVAAQALGEFGRAEALEPLITAMNDETRLPIRREPLTVGAEPVDARVAAALAVGKIGGERAEEALKALLNTSGGSGPYFRQTIAEAAAEALGLPANKASADVKPTDDTDVGDLLEKARAAVKNGEVLAAASMFRSAVGVDGGLVEPNAYLIPIYERIGEYDFAAKSLRCVSQSGIGLDPRLEDEWRILVQGTSPDEIRAALGL